MSAAGSSQSGLKSCVKFKVSDSLWVSQAQFKVDERHVLRSKWATAYGCHRLSSKHPQDNHVFSLKWGTPSAWTSLAQYKVSDTLQVTLTFRIVACYIELNLWRSGVHPYYEQQKANSFLFCQEILASVVGNILKRHKFITKWERERERHRETKKEREREGQTDRQTDRVRVLAKV